MIRFKFLFLLVLVSAYLTGATLLAPAPVRAQAIDPDYCRGDWAGFLSLPTWYKYLLRDPPVTGEGECNLEPFRTGQNTYDYNYLLKIGLAVFEIIMRVSALAAIGFVMYGGFQFLTSTGEPDKVAGARTTITNALIGLVISIFSVAIVNLVGVSI